MPEHKTKKNATSTHTHTQNLQIKSIHGTSNIRLEKQIQNLSLRLFSQVLRYFLFSNGPGGLLLPPTPITITTTLIRWTIRLMPAPPPPWPAITAMTTSSASIGIIRLWRSWLWIWFRIIWIWSPSSSFFPTLATTHSILFYSAQNITLSEKRTLVKWIASLHEEFQSDSLFNKIKTRNHIRFQP